MGHWPNQPVTLEDIFPHTDREGEILYQDDVWSQITIRQFLLTEDPSGLTALKVHLHKLNSIVWRAGYARFSPHPSKILQIVHSVRVAPLRGPLVGFS